MGDNLRGVSGSVVAPGVICSVNDEEALTYSILIDGMSGPGAGTVDIQLQNAPTGPYVTPTTPAWSFTVTTATAFQVSIIGPQWGVQVTALTVTSGSIAASITCA